jgi:hypothetical protein
MIVIATDGDPMADALNGYARNFVSNLGRRALIWLHGSRATAEAIAHALESHPGRPVFLFGHGVSPPGTGFRGSCGKIVLDVARISWFLSDRIVVGSFCDGQQVGAHATRIGFSMFGYRGPLAVPLWPKYMARMERAVLAGPMHVAQGGFVGDAATVASQAYVHLARELNQSSSWSDFMAVVVVSSNDPTHW